MELFKVSTVWEAQALAWRCENKIYDIPNALVFFATFDKNESAKKLKRSQTNKIISEEAQESKNSPNKNTIKNFEKVLITLQENFNKSSKNFLSPPEIKPENR